MEGISERAQRIAEEIIRRTACDHYRIVLNEERLPGITDSKIGGAPYWPADKPYPVDDKGKPMLMIMQVNCAEAHLQSPLPEQGMLQWYISLNPEFMYGCRGNFDDEGNGFRVVYHETVNGDSSPVDVPTHSSVDEMLTPVKREVAIDVVTEQTTMSVSDGRFNRIFFDIVHEITGAEHQGKMWYEYLNNEDCLYFEKNLGMQRPRHQMLGYPVFDQEDARRDIQLHDVLLFQLASQHSAIDRKELVMWGDMGNGFIFVSHDDLLAQDFTHAYYCWDCG